MFQFITHTIYLFFHDEALFQMFMYHIVTLEECLQYGFLDISVSKLMIQGGLSPRHGASVVVLSAPPLPPYQISDLGVGVGLCDK